MSYFFSKGERDLTTNPKKIIWPADTEPTLSILRHPKLTILFALKYKPLSYFIKVGIIGTFASSLISLIGLKLTAHITLGDLVLSTFITAIFMYFISVLLMAGVAYVIGAAFKGKGKMKPLFRALSLSFIPYIWTLPLVLFWMQLSPNTFFFLSFEDAALVDVAFTLAGPIALLVATIWSVVLTVQAIAIVHQFSKWKAIWTFIFVVLVMLFAFGFIQQIAYALFTL